MMKEKYPFRFIFFSTQKGKKHEEILSFAEKLFLPSEISVHSKTSEFSKAVVEPGFDQRIILILAGSSDDLAQILPFRDLLVNHPVILILPDSKKDTMTRALSLYPRYIDYIQNDLKDVFLVLKKMVKKIHRQTEGEKKPHP
jgi:hypothetical protein